MSMGPVGGIAGSAAGSPLSQTTGSDVQRAQQETGNQQRRIQADQKAENAAGIGEADGEDHLASERDADGRRPWEETPQGEASHESEGDSGTGDRRSKDPSGQSGNLLDLTG